jgi:hypothetical protein
MRPKVHEIVIFVTHVTGCDSAYSCAITCNTAHLKVNLMKKSALFIACMLFLSSQCILLAQNKTMGIGVETPNPNAVLHVESPTGNQGFILPRLSTVQRTASGFTSILTNSDNGLMVYDTDLKAIFIWDGLSWKNATAVTGGPELLYPYADSVTSLPDSSTVFKIKYDGGVSAAVEVVRFENTNMQNYGTVMSISTTGVGRAGIFSINNASNSSAPLTALTNGTGDALFVHHTGSSGNVASFQSDNAYVARIDKTGKGFFNGGTQASGADVAELFDIEGAAAEYEPGDVLVISETTDRTVEKNTMPNSTRVAGVYATKPGVLLTEKTIDENTGNLIPMGVIGVIPTKVCMENGPIRRGDMMVTSSRPGHAMKAIPVIVNGIEIYPTGAIIGKALENFEGSETGMIKVLVNVK